MSYCRRHDCLLQEKIGADRVSKEKKELGALYCQETTTPKLSRNIFFFLLNLKKKKVNMRKEQSILQMIFVVGSSRHVSIIFCFLLFS